eukprot:TRINITY_DN27408_c0_g1_i1.p1 TRINITY_DN27408_c0_g1~~TRINITY_DN27408_c0_g1_i1.p1  ORF type:complete len:729 (-),score=142.32 TRINITY_DN27408_c0_g1_i1:43-2229(-)
MISAICIVSIPSAEVRYINELQVYAVTAPFSILAYGWLLVVLVWHTPDKVDLSEALVTLLLFPLLVVLAFAGEKGWLGGKAVERTESILAAEMTPEQLAALVNEVKEEYSDLDLDEATLMLLVEKKTQATKSHLAYRLVVNRSLTRSNTFTSNLGSAKRDKLNALSMLQQAGRRISTRVSVAMRRIRTNASNSSLDTGDTKDWRACEEQVQYSAPELSVHFSNPHFAVRENQGKIILPVRRYADDPELLKHALSVKYRTVDGTAKSGDNADYIAVNGELVFLPGVEQQEVVVEILDDDEWEQAEDFHCELFDATILDPEEGWDVDEPIPVGKLGENQMATITIIDDDDPGSLAFEKDLVQFEDCDTDEVVFLKVIRRHGHKGRIRCKAVSERDSALQDIDFEEVDHTVQFMESEMHTSIPITIKAQQGRRIRSKKFRIVLQDPEGTRFENDADVCWIEIIKNKEAATAIDHMSDKFISEWKRSRVGRENWLEQFVQAVVIGGSLEEQAQAGWQDWFWHLLFMPWKLFFAILPPPDFLNGYACFGAALGGIGLLTLMIGELAELFGCVLEINDFITAISIVALGTSLPDTFASSTAAVQDDYADASIGNITGSNCVNVFLGLGLPWTIASVYWLIQGPTAEWQERIPESIRKVYPDGGFIVPAAGIGFSVSLFASCAVVALLLLALRRVTCGGELGGPTGPKYLSAFFLVLLWLTYIGISAWKISSEEE